MINTILLVVYVLGWLVTTICLTFLQKSSNLDVNAGDVLLNALLGAIWPLSVPVILIALGSAAL